jgi:branched-chain amino acid transport system substrate-binding protein
MKKIVAILVILAALAIAFVVMRQRAPDHADAIKIGILLPMTGDGSAWGKNAQKGIYLAIDELKHRPTRFHYVFVEEDSGTNPARAVSAFNKLISVDKIRFCVVDMISSDVLAIAPIAEKNKVIIISPGASSPKITDAGDYVFRDWPSDALQGKESARAVRDVLKWKRVAILRINNDYGEGLSDVFRKSLGADVTIVADEVYKPGESDFRTQVEKIKASNPDGVYLLAYPQEAPIIFRQAKELGLSKTFLGTETFESKELVQLAGDVAEGAVYTFPRSPDEDNAVVKAFRDAHVKRFGEPFGTPGDAAYDALLLFIDAIEKSGGDVENAKVALYAVKDYQGASGLITLDRNGDAIKPLELKTIRNGKFIPYQP